MNNIAFIFNSTKIQLYLYNCVVAIQKQFENVDIDVYIDSSITCKPISFNNFINLIDSKFSNFKQNPTQIIDLKNLKKINFINDLDASKTYDWIVLENENYNFNKCKIESINGFLTLDSNLEIIKQQVLLGDQFGLNILYKKIKSGLWQGYYETMKCENGFQNTIFKYLFNYQIYLVQLLKNESFEINLHDYEVVNSPKLNSIRKYNYYFKLVTKILTRKLFQKKLNWKIAIKHNDKTHFLKQPSNSYWADPFLIKKDNQTAVFFEELNSKNKGIIACATLNENFEILNKKIILDKDYHLSFPNVFEHLDKIFMIPESIANNSLDIYECMNFPFEWTFHSTLIKNIKLVDAVFIFHEDKYWLFANKVLDFEHDNNEKLFLYYSDDLLSDSWTPHVLNPIITDARLARNAGSIYSKNNKLYRVSQNCFNEYGGNIVVSEIIKLSTTIYEEIKTEEMFAPENYVGMHTMNLNDDLIVVDYLSEN